MVVGHIDHGKSTLLDTIRGTAIVEQEAGRITQAIGVSIVPIETIERICGNLLQKIKTKIIIPGLLFIDTPGHAAFISLRKRGGNLADIAILVVDINEGFKPQTAEAVEILKTYKTPFVVAANKIDLVPGWQDQEGALLQKINKQHQSVQDELDRRLYTLVGKLHELGFPAERFDRVEEYTKQIAIIPCSAKTSEGLPELMMVLTGLAQRYLEKSLGTEVKGYAKGTVLEVKEEKGLGTTLDVIMYDGTLKVNDTIIIGGLEKPIITKVRALLQPYPLTEMRDKKGKYQSVKEVHAATGVKISAPEIDAVIAGMPLQACAPADVERVKKGIMEEVAEVIFDMQKEGIVLKADSIGSLEALTVLLKEKGISIKKAAVGNITKKDMVDAEANYEKDPLKAAILGFNIAVEEDIRQLSNKVKVLTGNIIYKILEDYETWKREQAKALEAKELEGLVLPCKIELLKGYVFRQSNPAVVGCEILVGKAKVGIPLMKKEGKRITAIKSMQLEKEDIHTAEKGKQVAVAMEKVMVGRQIQEGDVLYSAIPEEDFKKLKELKQYLKPEEIEVMKEIASIMREKNPVWGI